MKRAANKMGCELAQQQQQQQGERKSKQIQAEILAIYRNYEKGMRNA